MLIQNVSDRRTNITQNIRIFRSLVPVLDLPLFDDMLYFWS